MTFFGLCEPAPLERVDLEEEDQGVWEYAPAPVPDPIVIDERKESEPAPQIIIEYVEKEPEPAPEPIEIIFPEPLAPPPVLSRMLGSRRLGVLRDASWNETFTPPLQEDSSESGEESSLPSLSVGFPASFSLKRASLRNYESYGGTYEEGRKDAGDPVNNALILASDRYIPGILETGINSQVGSKGGGSIIIQTNRHVFGYHGRNILIPKGSRLQCAYVSPEKVGVTRISMSCDRILLGGNRIEIFGLSSNVGDVQGRGGVSGAVDNRFWEKYGTALLITALSAGVQAGGKVIDSGDSSATAKVSEELSKRFGEITASVLQQAVDIRPVITISQGTRVQIRPASDWYINLSKGDER
jgi:type IV secretion system protein VirB10